MMCQNKDRKAYYAVLKAKQSCTCRCLCDFCLQGLDYNKEYIDFSDKPKWLFDLTEKGTVPVLKDADEKMIPDSGDICEYLAKKYPDPDLGKCTLEGVGDKLFPSFVNFLTKKGEEEKENEQALLDNLQEIEDYLAKNGPYLGGSQMAAYDAMVVRPLTAVVWRILYVLPSFVIPGSRIAALSACCVSR